MSNEFQPVCDLKIRGEHHSKEKAVAIVSQEGEKPVHMCMEHLLGALTLWPRQYLSQGKHLKVRSLLADNGVLYEDCSIHLAWHAHRPGGTS